MSEPLYISLRNSGGELCRETAPDAESAAKAAIEMIRIMGELHEGDRLVITAVYDETVQS